VPNPPVRIRKPHLTIADRLKDVIKRRHYGLGDPLPAERDLAQSLKVSRASVREGLIALEILGIVERRRGEGWLVRRTADAWLDVAAVEGRSPSDILWARLLVECAAVERVALRHDEDQADVLRRAVDDFAAEVDRGDYRGSADRQFHVAVARTGNTVLGDLVAYLWDLQDTEFFRLVEGAVGNIAQRTKRYLTDHRRIYSAVAEFDAPRAREEMRRHLEGVHQDLLGASEPDTDP
jgi:DNA-binding FadR family transcriptional regulator